MGSILHWSLFGQRGEPPTKRVVAEDRRKIEPIQKPVTSTWDQVIPRNDVLALLNGFQPMQMEDKWFIYADGPDAQGNASLHMFRSWTGHKMLELKLIIGTDESGEIGKGDAHFTEIVWESDEDRYRGQTEEGAKSMALEICRWCLGVELPSTVRWGEEAHTVSDT